MDRAGRPLPRRQTHEAPLELGTALLSTIGIVHGLATDITGANHTDRRHGLLEFAPYTVEYTKLLQPKDFENIWQDTPHDLQKVACTAPRHPHRHRQHRG